MNNTNRILLIDHITSEHTLLSNKGVLRDIIHVPLDTINGWFRDGVKIARWGNYSIYKIDSYINRYGK